MLLLLTAIYAGVAARYFFCQVVEGPGLARSSGVLRDRSFFLPESARGDILDRNGQQLTNRGHGWACVMIPRQFTQTSLNITRLAGLLQTDSFEVRKKINNARKRGNYMVLLKSCGDIDTGIRQQLSSMSGIVLVPLSRRYENSGLLAHIIGTLDDNSDGGGVPQGSSGLEKRFDRYLRDQVPSEAISVVLNGKKEIIPGLSPQVQINQTNSGRTSVETTIDRRIQEIVENVMDAKVKSGAVVVLDIESRDILAMGSRPTFDPYGQDSRTSDSQPARFLNRALVPFYPGSLFKIAVAATALENKSVAPADLFYCDGAHNFPSQLRIPCWKAAGHGWVSISQALAQSCNDTFIQIGLKTGRSQLLKACDTMHLVDPNIIGYNSAQTGSHIQIDFGAPALANASVGQNGVMMTPLQAANMLATAAGGGIYKHPRLVKGVRRGEEYIRMYPTEPGERVISQQTSRELQAALRL
ncbi:MAG: peptidoglycan D,D-transpeptidase FtsI family protein, partial [Acidobacteriota bacterium]